MIYTQFPACTCSDMQLHHVGCDCARDNWDDLAKITILPMGYVGDDMKSARVYPHLSDGQIFDAVKAEFGPFATYRRNKPFPTAPATIPTAPVTESYARAMSRNDNS